MFNSTVSDNAAGNLGGGIMNFGTLHLTNSTLQGDAGAPSTLGTGIFNFPTMMEAGTGERIRVTYAGTSHALRNSPQIIMCQP